MKKPLTKISNQAKYSLLDEEPFDRDRIYERGRELALKEDLIDMYWDRRFNREMREGGEVE